MAQRPQGPGLPPVLAAVLDAYRAGLFPMADGRGEPEAGWYDPPRRGQLPIAELHVPARLRRTVLQGIYTVTVDTAFDRVIDSCAQEAAGRPETWINRGIRDVFCALHREGYAHAVECWRDGVLAGGVYGLALGGAFMGESMFSRARDASKVALVHLCARLWRGGFAVLDTQFVNPHLLQFGAYEITREEYRRRLAAALKADAVFSPLPGDSGERDLVRSFLSRKN